jgi:hypothetical protein
MIVTYQQEPFYISGLENRLGKVRRNLDELSEMGLLAGPAHILKYLGYQKNYGVGEDETLMSLAKDVLGTLLKRVPQPRALLCQHTYGCSAEFPWTQEERDVISRTRYFPPALMREMGVGDLPYFSSFASGCSGLMSLMLTGVGISGPASDNTPIIAMTGDARPQGAAFDATKEQFLTSDVCSGFILGRQSAGYQVLGINYFSTSRLTFPLVESVKRIVVMTRELANALQIDLVKENPLIHYPNVFPKGWDMVTGYLGLPKDRQIIEGFADRAHCMSSDSIFTLATHHQGQQGRLHLVVNVGTGIHIGVCLLREQASA